MATWTRFLKGICGAVAMVFVASGTAHAQSQGYTVQFSSVSSWSVNVDRFGSVAYVLQGPGTVYPENRYFSSVIVTAPVNTLNQACADAMSDRARAAGRGLQWGGTGIRRPNTAGNTAAIDQFSTLFCN